jgi:folate-binding protein YgfZ
MNARYYAVLPQRAVLAVEGADRIPFLQGLISNDIAKAGAQRAIYAGLLTAQGRFLHDFHIAARGEAFWLDAEAERLDDLKRRLTLYKLRAKVALALHPELCVVAAWGDGAADALGLDAAPGAAREFEGGVAFADPRLAALGARAIVPPAATTALAQAGFVQASADAFAQHRMRMGVPEGSRDLPIEKALLLENGFDELHGVDWQKGCYVGQEVTARMKYRALVKRRLVPAMIAGAAPAPGATVMFGDQEAGEIRSTADGVALALLRIDCFEQARRSGATLSAGEATLTPLKPDWAVF